MVVVESSVDASVVVAPSGVAGIHRSSCHCLIRPGASRLPTPSEGPISIPAIFSLTVPCIYALSEVNKEIMLLHPKNIKVSMS
jgi:hypothetical protein